MKSINPIWLAIVFFMVSCGPTYVVQDAPPAEPAPAETVTYQSFYDGLSPYGNWINYPGYGYVWMPNAGPDFIPYNTNGNWVYSDAGWTWASNYSWGWAPFHYGRWFFETGYGWMWVPGNEWAPAWVSWRGGGDYYGWAPLGPNVSIDVAMGSYNPPANYWSFVPRQYIGNPGWHSYYANQSRNVTIINNTTIINNYSGSNRARYAYAPGPDVNEVRRVSGTNIQQVKIREVNAPATRVTGNQFDIYRPRIDAVPSNRTNASARPAPARVQNFHDMRPQTQAQETNPGPAMQNPANNRPVTTPAPSTPAYNNTRPATAPAPSTPAYNNNRPAPQSAANNNPAATGRPVDSRYNQHQGNTRPVQQQAVPQPSPANRRQMQTPPPVQPNNRPQNVRPAPVPQNNKPESHKPEPHKPDEKPKTRDTNG